MLKRSVKSHEEVLGALKSVEGSLPEKLTDVSIEIKATGVHFCWEASDEAPVEAKPVAPIKEETKVASKKTTKTTTKESSNKGDSK